MPSPIGRTCALWQVVMRLRPRLRAYSKLQRVTRSAALLDWRLIEATTPGTTSCSMPEYSPSVFSRMTTRSTSS